MSTEAAWWMDLPETSADLQCEAYRRGPRKRCREVAVYRVEALCDALHVARRNLCADCYRAARVNKAACGTNCDARTYIADVHAL